MGSIQPGLLYGVSIAPAVTLVQQTTSVTFNFTIENDLIGPATLRINLPIYSGSLPVDSNLTISSIDRSTTATSGKIVQGIRSSLSGQPTFIVEIQNFVANNTVASAKKSFSLTVQGLTNQISTKDAGLFSITTYDVFGGIPYVVDTVVIPTSYKATQGVVSQNGTVQFENPQNFARGGVYTFRFTTQSRIPPQGFVQLVVPVDLQIEPSTALSSGSCKQLTCSNATT